MDSSSSPLNVRDEISERMLRHALARAQCGFEVMSGPLEMLPQYDVKDNESRQAGPVCVCARRTLHQ